MPSKPSPSNPVLIRADHREERSGIARHLQSDPEVQFEFCQLNYGDFDCGNGLLLERKAGPDFSASITGTKRLFTQHSAAHDAGYRMNYILEGDVYKTRLHPNALVGALAWLTGLGNSASVPSNSVATTALLVKTYARHQQFGLTAPISMQPAKPKTLAEQRLAIVASLPGVGETKAQQLLEHFGSVRRLFAASAEEIQAIDGFGPGIAEKIQTALDA